MHNKKNPLYLPKFILPQKRGGGGGHLILCPPPEKNVGGHVPPSPPPPRICAHAPLLQNAQYATEVRRFSARTRNRCVMKITKYPDVLALQYSTLVNTHFAIDFSERAIQGNIDRSILLTARMGRYGVKVAGPAQMSDTVNNMLYYIIVYYYIILYYILYIIYYTLYIINYNIYCVLL